MTKLLSAKEVLDELGISSDSLIEKILNKELTAYLINTDGEKLAIPEPTDVKWSKECPAARAIKSGMKPSAFQKPGQNPDDGCDKEKCCYYNFKNEKADGCLELFIGGPHFDKEELFHSPDYSFRVDSVVINKKSPPSMKCCALIDLCRGLIFLPSDVDALRQKLFNTDSIAHHAPMKPVEPAPETKKSELQAAAITPSAENIFKRSGDFWQIRFDGLESKPLKHLDGFLYIAYLLQKPGRSLSCKELLETKNGQHPKTLSVGTYCKTDFKGKKAYYEKYLKLQNDLQNTNDPLIIKEIEEEMESLLASQKEKNFSTENKNQNNIKNRINTAYKHLEKKGMKKLVKHLRDDRYLRTDHHYSFSYVGSFIWEVIIG